MGKVRIDGLDYEVVPIAAQISVSNRVLNFCEETGRKHEEYATEKIASAIAEQLKASGLLELEKIKDAEETVYTAKVYVIKEVRE